MDRAQHMACNSDFASFGNVGTPSNKVSMVTYEVGSNETLVIAPSMLFRIVSMDCDTATALIAVSFAYAAMATTGKPSDYGWICPSMLVTPPLFERLILVLESLLNIENPKSGCSIRELLQNTNVKYIDMEIEDEDENDDEQNYIKMTISQESQLSSPPRSSLKVKQQRSPPQNVLNQTR